MRKNIKHMASFGALFLAIAVIIGYGYYRSRELIRGPEISVSAPTDGSSQNTPLLTVSGTASDVAYLDLNDGPIFTDGNGRFTEELLLSPGYNVVTLRGTDKFGKKVERRLEVVYDAPAPAASTTAYQTGSVIN